LSRTPPRSTCSAAIARAVVAIAVTLVLVVGAAPTSAASTFRAAAYGHDEGAHPQPAQSERAPRRGRGVAVSVTEALAVVRTSLRSARARLIAAVALLATVLATSVGVAPASAVAAATTYEATAYAYDAPSGLSRQDVAVPSPWGSPVGLSAASWEGSVSFGGSGVAAETALPVVEGAAPKIASLTSRYGEGIESSVLKSGTRYVDTASSGNINVFAARPDSSGFIRVTLDPSGQRIISAGLNTAHNVANGIANGRFVLVP